MLLSGLWDWSSFQLRTPLAIIQPPSLLSSNASVKAPPTLPLYSVGGSHLGTCPVHMLSREEVLYYPSHPLSIVSMLSPSSAFRLSHPAYTAHPRVSKKQLDPCEDTPSSFLDFL